MTRPLLAAGLVLATCVVACGKNECQAGQTRTCYSGPEGTAGVGICHSGVQTCGQDSAWLVACPGEQVPAEETCDGLDDDCNGKVDENVKNVCGGCAPVDGQPGDACSGCGHLACKGTESLKCVAPATTPGDVCEAEGCPGRYKCGSDGLVVCQATRKNACEVCGGPAITGLGDACQNADGCDGTFKCNLTGTTATCQAPRKNSCGVCGLADVPHVGDGCLGANGCPGGLVCTAAGDGSTCDEQPQNACARCGGPAVTGLGDACGAGACAGKLTCNDQGDGTSCDFLGRGDVCAGPDGCSGKVGCGADGLTTACDAPVKNLCGVCGGPVLTGVVDEACTIGSCHGVTACNAGGTALICLPDASCLPQTSHVVISELAATGPKGDLDEFVELYNPTGAEVAIGGWALWYRSSSSSGNVLLLVSLPSGSTIASRGYFLVASATALNSGYSGSVQPDARFAGGLNMAQSPTGGATVLLTSNGTKPRSITDAHVVDGLGYGRCWASTFAEGGACGPAHPVSPGSLERKARPTSDATTMTVGGTDENAGNGQDADQNGDDATATPPKKGDFVTRATRDPQSSRSPTEP